MRLAFSISLPSTLLALSVFSASASAQLPGSIIDLNAQPAPKPTAIDHGRFASQQVQFGSLTQSKRDFKSFVEVDGVHYFAGTNFTLGNELYRTDGTALGTFLVDDTTPGPKSTGPCLLTPYLGDLFFLDSLHTERQLYRMSRATGAVTSLGVVGDDALLYGEARMVVVGGKLLFVGKNAAEGFELWASDGTAAGTGLLKALSPGAASTQIRHLLANASGTFAVFLAEDANGARSVWVTDGTSAGTQELISTQFYFTNHPTVPEWTTRFGDDILFARVDASGATQLMRTDGAGVQALATIATQNAAAGLIDLSDAELFGGELYFAANDVTHGMELWKTDGTSAGTQLVHDVWPGPASSWPLDLAASNGRLFFDAETDVNGRELYAWDGAGVELFDLQPGAAPSFFVTLEGSHEIVATSGGVLFRAGKAHNGGELYFSDGTQAGTGLVADLNATGDSRPHSFTPLANGDMLFAASADLGEAGLYRYSAGNVSLVEALPGHIGTESSNVTLLKRLAPDIVLLLANLSPVPFGSRSLVRLSPAGGIEELVKASDYADIRVGLILDGVAATGKVVFSANSVASGTRHFFVTEGVPGEVHELPGLLPAAFEFTSGWMGATEHGLAFSARAYVGGSTELSEGVWVVAADNGSLTQLDVLEGGGLDAAQLDGKVIYSSKDPAGDLLICVTDGTVAGTHVLAGPLPASSAQFRADGEHCAFSVNGKDGSVQVYSTDGTVAGTQLAPTAGLDVTSHERPVWFDGEVYFAADDGVLGEELYAFEPASGQVRLVADILTGPLDGRPHDLIATKDGVVFGARDPEFLLQIYRADRTGTTQLSNLSAAQKFSGISSYGVSGDEVYFTVSTATKRGLIRVHGDTATLVHGALEEDYDVLSGMVPYDGGVALGVQTPAFGVELLHLPLVASLAEGFGEGDSLSATTPHLGATVIVRSETGPGPLVSALALSGQVTWGQKVPGLADELLWLDPQGLQVVGMFAGGNWSHPAQVPSSPALLGAHATLQVLYLGASLPGELSNPVALTLGL